MEALEVGDVLGFWKYGKRFPDTIALVSPEGASRTYGELLERANRLANALIDRGFTPGTVLATAMRNSFEYYDVFMATEQIGVNVLTLSTHLTLREAEYILTDSGARGLVVDPDFEPTFRQAAKAAGIPASRIYLHDQHQDASSPAETLESLVASGSPEEPADRTAGVTLLYTSGTTGKPKGVRRLVGQRSAPEKVYATHAAKMIERFDWEPGRGVFLLCGPLYHRASSAHSIHGLMMGHTLVVVDKWDAEQTLRLIERFRVTTSHMVPTMFHRLLALPREVRSRYDLSSLRSVVHAAAPCPVHEKRQMLDWWGMVIYEYYAASEGGGTVVKPMEWVQHPGTVGRAWKGASVEIRDETGRTRLPADEVGYIWMSLEGQDFEYLNDPVKTAASRVDGWFTAGDLGRMDPDGWLYIADRRSDLIISGGVNIYPAEIESALLMHRGVDEVAVVGVPDEDWGQAVRAFVKLRPGYDESVADDLRRHCKEYLSRYKQPRDYIFIEELPRNEIGKVLKRRLR